MKTIAIICILLLTASGLFAAPKPTKFVTREEFDAATNSIMLSLANGLAGTSAYVRLSGSTMTGPLILSNTYLMQTSISNSVSSVVASGNAVFFNVAMTGTFVSSGPYYILVTGQGDFCLWKSGSEGWVISVNQPYDKIWYTNSTSLTQIPGVYLPTLVGDPHITGTGVISAVYKTTVTTNLWPK